MDACWPLPFLVSYACSCLIRLLPVLSSTLLLFIQQTLSVFVIALKKHLHRCRNVCFYQKKYLASVIKYLKKKNRMDPPSHTGLFAGYIIATIFLFAGSFYMLTLGLVDYVG